MTRRAQACVLRAEAYERLAQAARIELYVAGAKYARRAFARAVPLRTRMAIFERDEFACRYCGAQPERLTIDHVVPLVDGGSNALPNLVACCSPCNSRKRARTPEQAGMVLR